jgi:putative peptide zinc metalloprotease protein
MVSSSQSTQRSTVCDGQAGDCVVDPYKTLRETSTSLRPDLQVTRATNRGEAVYVVFDPISFQSHRLTLDDYAVVARITSDRTLAECFETCVRDGLLGRDSEGQFFGFVKQLGSLGLLTMESHTPKELYDRRVRAENAARKSQILGFLFLTIPLSNPDKFLDRTIGRFRILFSTPVVIAWLIAMVVAISIIVARWDLFWQPLNGLLAAKNLVFIWFAFVGLKIWHELGHGYACKLFGGRVPEMGCKLIVGMPLAYVDASSAWSFPRRRDRMIVMLGGMYFEMLLTVPATIIWAYWPHTMIGSFAHQIVFMAGIATLLFNINPLMKFDGYFILSDALGIPNLRARALHEVKRQLKTHMLGIPALRSTASSRRERTVLITYGIAATLYGWMLMISIAGLIATRLLLVGIVLAGFQLGSSIYRGVVDLYRYLWHDEEAAAVRGRAKFVGCVLAIGVPGLVAFCPVPSSQYVLGLVTASKLTHVRVATPGFVESIIHPVPDSVATGQTLVKLRNVDVETELSSARLGELAARQAMHMMRQSAPADEARQLQIAIASVANRVVVEQTREELTLTAPHDGRLASILPRQRVGAFLQTGDVIASIAKGGTQVRAWLNEEQLATSRLDVGKKVGIRIVDDRTRSYEGTIVSVAPANKAIFEDFSLTTLGEGKIPYDPISGQTLEQVFQLLIDLPELDSHETLQGLSVSVRLDRRYESLGHWAIRHTTKFINALFTNTN